MKKKIIKSYFFKQIKNNYKNPSINALFCFSKRSIKYRKQFFKANEHRQKSKSLSKAFTFYKFYINMLITYNQWMSNNTILCAFFLKSCYVDKRITSNVKGVFKKYKDLQPHFLKQIYFWYKLKNRINRNLTKSLIQYPKTGMLSSHFVHFLSKKNVVYQTRSKYRLKIFNMNSVHYYLYMHSSLLYSYLRILDWKLYFFTSNLSKQGVVSDSNFNVTISSWVKAHAKISHNTQINPEHYNISDYNGVLHNKLMLTKYFNETDLKKKELLLPAIQDVFKSTDGILTLVQLLYETRFKAAEVNTSAVFEFSNLYYYL